MVAHPVEVLTADVGVEVGAIGEAAGILVGVAPDLARVVLQVELGDAGVGAVLEVADYLGLGDAGHGILLVEARVEQPHAAQKRLCGILRGTAGLVVLAGVTVLRRDEVDGGEEVVGNGLVDLVDGGVGRVLHFELERQREGLVTVGHDPEEEGAHEVGLTQVPVLVVALEEVVVHRLDGLEGVVAAVDTLIIAAPGGVVLVAGDLEQTVGGRSLGGGLGTVSVEVVAGDHVPEQGDAEDTAGVEGEHRIVGRVHELLRILLGLREGGGVRLLVVRRIEQVVDLVAGEDHQTCGQSK